MSILRLARPRNLSARQSIFSRSFMSSHLRLNAAEPTVLPKLRTDLKEAMRSKDKPRLTVLRSLLAEITNASKTPKPVASDSALLSLLNKQIALSQQAVSQFEAANRADLVQKENEQIAVLAEYAANIPQLSAEEVDRMIDEVVTPEQRGAGEKVTGKVMGGVVKLINSRPVDMEYVRKRIEEVVGGSAKTKV